MIITHGYRYEEEVFSISDEIQGWGIFSDKDMNVNVIALMMRFTKYKKLFPYICKIDVSGSYFGSKPYHMLTVRISLKPNINMGV